MLQQPAILLQHLKKPPNGRRRSIPALVVLIRRCTVLSVISNGLYPRRRPHLVFALLYALHDAEVGVQMKDLMVACNDTDDVRRAAVPKVGLFPVFQPSSFR